MKTNLFLVVCLLSFGLSPSFCSAQVILYGCTASLTATPATSKLVDINPMTGLANNPRDTGIGFLAGIAAHPTTGELFGLTSFASNPANALVTFNVATGQSTLIGITGLPIIVEGDLAFNPTNGQLYGLYDGINANDRTLFQIDPLTGMATTIGNIAPMGDFSALAFSSTGSLFAINSSGSSPSLLVGLDASNAMVTSTTTMNVNLGATVGMAFNPETGIVYVGDGGENATNSLYTLNVNNGVLAPVGPLDFPSGIAGLTFITVPEPTSIVLSGFAAIVCLIAGRFRFPTFGHERYVTETRLPCAQ